MAAPHGRLRQPPFLGSLIFHRCAGLPLHGVSRPHGIGFTGNVGAWRATSWFKRTPCAALCYGDLLPSDLLPSARQVAVVLRPTVRSGRFASHLPTPAKAGAVGLSLTARSIAVTLRDPSSSNR